MFTSIYIFMLQARLKMNTLLALVIPLILTQPTYQQAKPKERSAMKWTLEIRLGLVIRRGTFKVWVPQMVLTAKIMIESKITVSTLSAQRPLQFPKFESFQTTYLEYRHEKCDKPINSLEFYDAVTALCLPISSVFSLFFTFIKSILKSLVILAIWLALSGVIFSQITVFFCSKSHLFLSQWEKPCNSCV